MESTSGHERGIVLPDFSGNRLTMLNQLRELAERRVSNEAWYTIEWLANDAAKTVTALLNAHMYYEEGARARGEEPIKFIDFVLAQIEVLIAAELPPEQMSLGNSSAAISESVPIEPMRLPQTASDVDKMIRIALGHRGSNPNRRQYSNTHNRPRK